MGIFSLFKKKKKMNKKLLNQYAVQAQRCLEIYDDSQRLFQETNNPEVFFMRYELAVKQLNDLAEIIEVTNIGIKYKGDNLAKKIALLDNERNREYLKFIERYYAASALKADKLKTEKGRQNNLHKSLDKLLDESQHLSKEHLNRIQELWDVPAIVQK